MLHILKLSSSLKIILKDTKSKLSIETIINNELELVQNKKNFPQMLKRLNIYMIFHTAQRKVNPLHLTINNNIIERVTQFDFLRFILNENLTWKDHINKISKALVF